MSFDDRTGKKILVCSIALFIASLAYRILNPFTQPTVNELTYTGKQPQESRIKTLTDIKNLNDTELNLHTELFFKKYDLSYEAEKDIFYKPQPILENTAKELPDEIDISDAEIAADQSAESDLDKVRQESERASALSAIVEELLHIKVMGACKTSGKLSFFIKDGDNVMLIGRGDKLKGQYPVTELTQDHILIKIPQFNEEVRINLKDFNENRYL